MSSKPDKYLSASERREKLKYKTDTEDNMSPIHFLMVALYFVSIFLLMHYFGKTLMNFFALFSLFMLFAAAAFLVPISIYRKKFTMSYYEFSLMNILGIAPCLTSLMLLLNFHISTNEHIERYKITRREVSNQEMILHLESNALNKQEFLRTIDDEEMLQYPDTYSDTLSITFAEGLFGYEVVKNREFQQ